MILTLPFSRFHHYVVLNFTKSGSQLCTVQQDPTVRLQGRDCAADCRCQALPQTIKQLHSPNLDQVHLDTWEGNWQLAVLNFYGKEHWCSNMMGLSKDRPSGEGQKIVYHWHNCCAVPQLLFCTIIETATLTKVLLE